MEGVKIDLEAELSGTHLGSTADLVSCDQSHLMKRDLETPVVCQKKKSTLNFSQILPLFRCGSKSCSWALPYKEVSLNLLDHIQKSKVL